MVRQAQGLQAALALVDRDLDALSGASAGRRAVAVLLAWHLSTSAYEAPSGELVGKMIAALDESSATRGCRGNMLLCCDGRHSVVGDGSQVLLAEPGGCTTTSTMFDLLEMATVLDRR